MKSDALSQGYEVHLPVSVWTPNRTLAHGMTEFMSSHDIRFSLDGLPTLEQGSSIALRVSLPPELTGGDAIQLRATGQVLRTERDPEQKRGQLTIVATLDWYDFARGETATLLQAADLQHKNTIEMQRKCAATS